MKKLLSILGAISLAGTSTTNLIACNKPNNNKPIPTTTTTDVSVKGKKYNFRPQQYEFNGKIIKYNVWIVGVVLKTDYFSDKKNIDGKNYLLITKGVYNTGRFSQERYRFKNNNYPYKILENDKIYEYHNDLPNPYPSWLVKDSPLPVYNIKDGSFDFDKNGYLIGD